MISIFSVLADFYVPVRSIFLSEGIPRSTRFAIRVSSIENPYRNAEKRRDAWQVTHTIVNSSWCVVITILEMGCSSGEKAASTEMNFGATVAITISRGRTVDGRQLAGPSLSRSQLSPLAVNTVQIVHSRRIRASFQSARFIPTLRFSWPTYAARVPCRAPVSLSFYQTEQNGEKSVASGRTKATPALTVLSFAASAALERIGERVKPARTYRITVPAYVEQLNA